MATIDGVGMGRGDGEAGDSGELQSAGTHNELSGRARDAVMARDVTGGVHFHTSGQRPEVVPQQLPGDVRGFVNRIADLARLDAVLSEDSIDPSAPLTCVIVGTAGVGKTSLAVHWAFRVRERFPDGQLYVNLRGYDPGEPVTPEQALDRFLRALAVPAGAIPSDLEARAALYRSILAGRRMLVVLDNAASVKQVRPLLPGASSCLALVTSRSRMSGLIARDGARRVTVDLLSEPEAVKLLRHVTDGYRDRDDDSEVAELARLCVRLPLALRIAAERAAARPRMPLGDLIMDLRDESALWDALSSEDNEEADAVRTVFAWSYRALPEGAAQLFRMLGLHPGPEFALPAAAALANVSVRNARHLIDVLVGAHLLEQVTRDRYQYHDLLRAYAADQVMQEEVPEVRSAALDRLFAWYLYTAHAAASAVGTHSRLVQLEPRTIAPPALDFTDRTAAVRWFDAEWSNLRAVTFAAERLGMDSYAWQLPAVFRIYYEIRNSFDDRLVLARVAFSAAQRAGDRLGEAESLHNLGITYYMTHHQKESLDAHMAVREIRRNLGDREGELRAISNASRILINLRRFEEARECLEPAMPAFREVNNRVSEAIALVNLIWAYLGLGYDDRASDALNDLLDIQRDLSHELALTDTMARTAVAQLALGDAAAALANAQASVDFARETESAVNEGGNLLYLGEIQLDLGYPADALVSFQRSVAVHREQGNRGREAQALDGAGKAFASLGRSEEAVDFHRRAVSQFRDVDETWHLAIALKNLADALDSTGAREKAQDQWREALTLLDMFTDLEAGEIHAQVAGLIGQDPHSELPRV